MKRGEQARGFTWVTLRLRLSYCLTKGRRLCLQEMKWHLDIWFFRLTSKFFLSACINAFIKLFTNYTLSNSCYNQLQPHQVYTYCINFARYYNISFVKYCLVGRSCNSLVNFTWFREVTLWEKKMNWNVEKQTGWKSKILDHKKERAKRNPKKVRCSRALWISLRQWCNNLYIAFIRQTFLNADLLPLNDIFIVTE